MRREGVKVSTSAKLQCKIVAYHFSSYDAMRWEKSPSKVCYHRVNSCIYYNVYALAAAHLPLLLGCFSFVFVFSAHSLSPSRAACAAAVWCFCWCSLSFLRWPLDLMDCWAHNYSNIWLIFKYFVRSFHTIYIRCAKKHTQTHRHMANDIVSSQNTASINYLSRSRFSILLVMMLHLRVYVKCSAKLINNKRKL